jgi:hypothetical protein
MKKETEQPKEFILEGTIKYKLKITAEGYEFENEASISADLAGLIICKRVHEDMSNEIDKLKEIGIQPQFKGAFQQRKKDLVKSLHTLDKSIKHLFKFVAHETLKKVD